MCACAMTACAGGRTSGAEENATEAASEASAAPASPMSAPSEPSSAGGSTASSTEGRSDLLLQIKGLQDTQKALKEQKRKCALEIKNAMKRKTRLQGKASQLSDSDLVEVLRMRKAKKVSIQTSVSTSPPGAPQPDP